MSDIRSIDNETLAAVVSAALYRVVGPKKRFSYEQAADAVCVEERTMQSWVLGQTPPQSHKLIRLCRWLGPDFANEVLGLAGLHTLLVEPPEGDEFKLNMSAAELCFELSQAFADDGKVDHIEQRRIVAIAKQLLPVLGSYISRHEGHVHAVAAE